MLEQELRDALAHSNDELEDDIVLLYETLDPEKEGAVDLAVLKAAMVASGAFDADEVGRANMAETLKGLIVGVCSVPSCWSVSCWTMTVVWADKPSWSCAPSSSTVDYP
jgi:hypothetical protein